MAGPGHEGEPGPISLEQRLEELNAQLGEAQEAVRQLTEENQRLTTENQQLRDELDDVNARLDALEHPEDDARAAAAATPAADQPTAEHTAAARANNRGNTDRAARRRNRRWIGAAAVALAAGGLWVAGVFDGGSKKHTESLASANTPVLGANNHAKKNLAVTTANGNENNGGNVRWPDSAAAASATATPTPNSAPSAPAAKAAAARAAAHNKASQYEQQLGASVNSAVKALHTHNKSEFQAFVRASYARLGHFNDLSVSHHANKMSELKDFDKNASSNDIREGVWLSAINDAQYRAAVWNQLHGRAITAPIPSNVSAHEQLHSIYNFMNSADLKTGNVRLNGLVANGAIREIDGHRFVVPTVFKDVRAVMMSANGHHLLIKAGGGSMGNTSLCLNLEEFLKQGGSIKVEIPATPQTPSTPKTPETPPKKTPKTPSTPSTPAKPQTPSTPPAHHHPRPKHDSNTTPAGVPGEAKGQGGDGLEPSRPVASTTAPVSQPQQELPPPAVTDNGESDAQLPADSQVEQGNLNQGTTGPAPQNNGNPDGQESPATTPPTH